jgi:hypothetical protein
MTARLQAALRAVDDLDGAMQVHHPVAAAFGLDGPSHAEQFRGARHSAARPADLL